MTTKQLNVLQHTLQQLATQKQQVESQLAEVDSALEEIPKSSTTYKIVGKIMLATSKEALLKELQEKKEAYQIRISNISKQEENVSKKFEEVQQQVMKNLQQ